jgi:hypothetical protein
METKVTIKDIHDDFKNVDVNLAKNLIKPSEAEMSRINKMRELGFTNFKEAKELDPKKIKAQNDKLALIEKYRVLAPQYKFIPKEDWIALCNKYGLIWGDSNLYTESIPVDIQEKVIAFHIADNSVLAVKDVEADEDYDDWDELEHFSINNTGFKTPKDFRDLEWRTMKGEVIKVRNIEDSHLLNLLNFTLSNLNSSVRNMYSVFVSEFLCRQGVISYTDNGIEFEVNTSRKRLPFWIGSVDVKETTQAIEKSYADPTTMKIDPRFVICAAKHMFNLTKKTIDSKTMEILPIPRPIPKRNFFMDDDPIVAVETVDGFLMVGAWGDEASHSEAINHFLN